MRKRMMVENIYNLQKRQSTLCSYLRRTSHPIVDALKTCMPNRITMPWRNLKNSVDDGVFVMRHLETYKGKTIKEWKCGLANESEEQKVQLNDLRVKYLSKIILSDINIHKDAIVAEVRDYAELLNEV